MATARDHFKSLLSLLVLLVFLTTRALMVATQSDIDEAIFTTRPTAQLVPWNKNAVLMSTNYTKVHKDRSSYTPVVFWHGMGDTAKGSVTIDRLALEKKYPGIQVFSIQIGKSTYEDELAGYFSNLNDQVQGVCEAILGNKQIKQAGAFNGVGFSQGSQFLRALVQRCPFAANGIKVRNLITLGGQHQGVYGLPNCNEPKWCDYIRYLLSEGAYEKRVQQHIVQAQYWHDPMHEQDYKEKNIFLSDVNNEKSINETYKRSLLQLENLVLVKFEQDEMVIPKESSHFEFYVRGQTKEIESLNSSLLWTEDRLGLRQMFEDGRLKLISIPGNHLQYKMSWFLSEIGDKYLKN